jgi:hypothetical protein
MLTTGFVDATDPSQQGLKQIVDDAVDHRDDGLTRPIHHNKD